MLITSPPADTSTWDELANQPNILAKVEMRNELEDDNICGKEDGTNNANVMQYFSLPHLFLSESEFSDWTPTKFR